MKPAFNLVLAQTQSTLVPFFGAALELAEYVDEILKNLSLEHCKEESIDFISEEDAYTGYGVSNGYCFILLYARRHSLGNWMVPEVVWGILCENGCKYASSLYSSRPLTVAEVDFISKANLKITQNVS